MRGSDFYDENDSYHSCHSSVSYGKEDSPGWDGDDPHGMYSDEGGYLRDGGEEEALYAEEERDMYGEVGDYNYEDEEEMPYEEDENMYPLDGTLSEDQEPPYTPTPTSTAPTLMPPSDSALSTRPPLEKQTSLHQQQSAHDHLLPPTMATDQLPVSQEDQLQLFPTDSSKIPFPPTQTDLSTPTTHTPAAIQLIPLSDTESQEPKTKPEPKPEPLQVEPQPLEQVPEGENSLSAPDEKPEEPPVPRWALSMHFHQLVGGSFDNISYI